MTTTDHAMHELPTLPTNLLMLIGEYGMARSDKCTPIEVTHRWLLLIDGIKAYATDYARAAIQQAAGAVPEGCRIVPIEPTESMLVFVHRLAWINAVNASPSPLGREAGSSDHLVPCAGGGVQGRGWCQYIAGMVECYLKTDHSTEDREAAIAGIIERRLHRLPAFCDVIAPRPDAPTSQINPGSATGEDGHGS